MMRSHRCHRAALALVIIATLALAPGLALDASAAGPRAGFSSDFGGGLLARFLDLFGIWSKEGMGADPNGAPGQDAGMGGDPNGGTSSLDEGMGADPSGLTATGDEGMGIDPNGDEGMGIDPSGATTSDDAGMGIDPNGAP